MPAPRSTSSDHPFIHTKIAYLDAFRLAESRPTSHSLSAQTGPFGASQPLSIPRRRSTLAHCYTPVPVEPDLKFNGASNDASMARPPCAAVAPAAASIARVGHASHFSALFYSGHGRAPAHLSVMKVLHISHATSVESLPGHQAVFLFGVRLSVSPVFSTPKLTEMPGTPFQP